MNKEVLKNHRAKTSGESLYTHIKKCKAVLNNLKEYLSLNDNQVKIIENMIEYHDVGKIIKDNQILLGKKPYIRHEIISALMPNLNEIERVGIVTHHKSISKIKSKINLLDEFIGDDEIIEKFISYKKEIEEVLGEELVDIDILIDVLEDDTLLKDKENIFLKGVFMLCDHIASADINKFNNLPKFNDVFKFKKYNSIQMEAKNTGNEDIIIKAPTGMGKTESSLFYIDKVQNSSNSRRVFYILPYTASINAMYERFKDKGLDVAMLHNKAEYFLYKELTDIRAVKNEYSIFKKLISPITICTIFQISKFIFNCKFNEMILSMLSNSIFIIDEIHAFDLKNFTMIVRVLKFLKKNFNINICIMSASIPEDYINIMKKELGINKIIEPPANELKAIVRHRVHLYKSNIFSKIEDIKKDILDNKKVLVCVNTVKTAQEIYTLLEKDFKALLIHGRFNALDRSEIEKKILNEDIQALIGTQAIEVSLDIDYDTLYTEIAPIDSLIQRFGRINRKRFDLLKDIKDIHIVQEYRDSYIYDKPLIDKTYEILMKESIIRENKIQEMIDYVYKDEFNTSLYNSFNLSYDIIEGELSIGKWDVNILDKTIGDIGECVLPKCIEKEYKDLIDSREYMFANSLLVNISTNQLNKLLKNRLLEKYNDIYIAYIDYKKDIGLIL